MDEAEQQQRMVTKSSIKKKPLGDITNIICKPYNQSKIHGSSPASNSSIGSTPNPIHIHRLVTSPPGTVCISDGYLVGDENQTAYARRQNARSKTKADVASYQTSIQETRNNTMERSVPLCSSILENIKDLGKINQSCLDKTTNDGKKMSVVPRYSSMENVKDKGKAGDMPNSTHHMKNTPNNKNTSNPRSTLKIKDKGKENVDVAVAVPSSLMKKMDKGKEIAVPLDYPSMKNLRNTMMEVCVPLKGVVIKERKETVMGSRHVDLAQKDKGKENTVQSGYSSMGNTNIKTGISIPNSIMKKMDKGKAIDMPLNYPLMKIKDRGETVSGSSCVDLAEKDKRKAVFTPIIYRSSVNQDKRGSCPPLLRTTSNRNEADGVEDIIQFKPKTEPPQSKKIRRCSLKEEYALPQDYVEQQRAYFKEIDDLELQVEEV